MVNEFQDTPSVELLQWLARGSLKQNLLRAIRLWVWLYTIYGDKTVKLDLPNGWSYSDWRPLFFSETHPQGEQIPTVHDANCACAKTVREWLFTSATGIAPDAWIKAIKSHYCHQQKQNNKKHGDKSSELENAETELLIFDSQDKKNKKTLEQILDLRLFAVTRRTLQRDLEILAELGWLRYENQKYYNVTKFPSRPVNSCENIPLKSDYELNFMHADLACIAENLSNQINGVQRFFLQLDYVTSNKKTDLVDNWHNELKELWKRTPVPPIKITYDSARVGGNVDCVVFPVCIYYMQRTVYLCACGDSPDRTSDWYNFRIDRIQNITPLTWNYPHIPNYLQQRYKKASLPTPDEIAIAIDQTAWGFDFYLKSRLMILRFDDDYDNRYIRNTNRHETFKRINYEKAKNLIVKETIEPDHRKILLNVLQNRSPQDAYYQANYRHKDNGIMMRLRAWRPRCEVLLPFDLRQSIAKDAAEELKLYQDKF
ncbi:hypothetical protein DSM106972_088290 [Dulcicalothrix desertica PCC 7102]|uniref:WYL domain-containing protein n=1 Tax=Dulcicalothrix desertica PCC 7102 TaxID=232991 RepID=A0A3S1BWU9_9CYAN|nr:TIGR03985 family CRISPR-associated protein [Dulcicalothrix desertica]RUS96158.1 hypothetical protein DSM106972_088290 [Dulcicalothrix desertica PCC 7102]TWH53914.1 CRISPR-associated protein (TIGR03985 family) [Dulcicalothrix desertica PCC 7102]